ncbi:MAG TPA: acyltransferase [Bryobacteraceae bacterium]|nr:acyltransferase [Bryobacteraceae bacterium]
MAAHLTVAPHAPAARGGGSRYIPELDGIRGIAILLVISFHFGLFAIDSHSTLYTVYRSVVGLGWAGVDLFFVLSGCLITGILLDSKSSRHYFRSFYMRRVLRILPLYYICVFAFFCIVLPAGNTLAPAWAAGQEWMRVPPGESVWYWLHLSNWRSAYGILQTSPITHFWSLAIEEQFYLVWPLVVLCCSEAGLLNVCIGLVLLSAGLRNFPEFQAQVKLHSDFIYRLTPFRIDPLAFGAMLALLSRRAAFREWSRRWLWLPAASGAAVLLSIVFILRSGSYRTEMMSRYGYTAVSLICFAAVAYGLMRAGSRSAGARLLRVPPLVSIGKYSYAMYVLHLPVAFFWPVSVSPYLVAGSRVATGVVSTALGTGIAYLLALASWHLVEHRFLRLKERFSYHGSAPRAAPAAHPVAR